MKKGVKKLLLASLLLLAAKYSCLFSQDAGLEKLSNYNTSWTSVLPGTCLCQPEVTSYGFCLATDARNLMGFSSEGKLLWEKNIGRLRKISLTALRGDFILFHDQNSNIIKLFNPSGSEIWSKSLDFKPAAKPFAGRDGRFFIHGDGNVVCYGINGMIRWKVKTASQKALPIQELPDGSIVVFLADQGGKTKGLRLSPFGEELEDITFAASIKEAFTCSQGILLIFTDGSAGLFSVTDGLTQSRWAVSNFYIVSYVDILSQRAVFAYHRSFLDMTEMPYFGAVANDGTFIYKTRFVFKKHYKLAFSMSLK